MQDSSPAYEQVADALREEIVTGRLAPGVRLPNEAQLTKQFGVSRSTVREALRVLSSQNLVSTARGVTGGSFVSPPEPERIQELLETNLGLLAAAEQVSVDQLLEARRLLEVPAAGLAASRRTDAQLDAMEASLATSSQVGEGPDFEGHARFHATILQAAANPLLEVLTGPIFSVLRTRFLRDAAPARFWRQVALEHERILVAIHAGDPARAANEMEDHLRSLTKTYKRIERVGNEPTTR